ncbi:hypothetical protein [Novosphingobium sp. HII-3]|uniref:hypothetical protein n=1 Tax=Novosphingobium sp. HII-3 TaxID=2075565 RepID=UPI000CDB784A|nr:hypothetical protein [Novosphingobium sp. HII-3]
MSAKQCALCAGTGAKDYAGFAMDPCDHAAAPHDQRTHEVEVSRDDAVKFLEHACRNWRHLAPLSEDDVQDVAEALAAFSRARAKGGAA